MKDCRISLYGYPKNTLYDVNCIITKKARSLGYKLASDTFGSVTGFDASRHVNTLWDFRGGTGRLLADATEINDYVSTDILSLSAFLCLPEPTKFVVGNLYKGELGTVVLCTAEAKDGNLGNEFSGISIARDSGISYMIGMTSDTWNCSVFKPFNGTIVDGVLNES